jgi:predicted phosphodiesterase
MYDNVLIVSDTPRRLYPWLRKTIARYNISKVIHLGDLADDIKLELAPHKKWIYIDALKTLRRTLNGIDLTVIPGNHDDEELIREILGVEPLPEGTELQINNKHLILYHHPPTILPNIEDNTLILYGHTPEQVPIKGSLNVLTNAYILLPDGSMVKINYPAGTNRERKLHLRGG